MKKKEEKILVLVTAQKTFLRLIEQGAAVAQECGGELHILHVQKDLVILDIGINIPEIDIVQNCDLIIMLLQPGKVIFPCVPGGCFSAV